MRYFMLCARQPRRPEAGGGPFGRSMREGRRLLSRYVSAPPHGPRWPPLKEPTATTSSRIIRGVKVDDFLWFTFPSVNRLSSGRCDVNRDREHWPRHATA